MTYAHCKFTGFSLTFSHWLIDEIEEKLVKLRKSRSEYIGSPLYAHFGTWKFVKKICQ